MCDESLVDLYDELLGLQQAEDMEAFEKRRQEILDKHIIKMCNGCEEKLKRCRAMQWRIDHELSKYKDPIARYNKMVEMFWAQFRDLQEVLNKLPAALEGESIPERETAKVFEFRNPNK